MGKLVGLAGVFEEIISSGRSSDEIILAVRLITLVNVLPELVLKTFNAGTGPLVALAKKHVRDGKHANLEKHIASCEKALGE